MRFLPVLFLLLAGQLANSQELPVPRRISILTQAFLNSAEVREVPTPLPKDKSHVLVLFRLAESGRVMDSRATGGSDQARAAAIGAVAGWRFKPTLLSGRPAQMQSGAQFDFSVTPVGVQAPQPMSADQISPGLSARCSLALVKNDPDSVSICRKEAQQVDMNHAHTAMESLSAHDELGLALMRFEHDARQALAEFNLAIDLAPQGLNPSDGEWAELHWHRASSEQQIGESAKAYNDFAIAEQGLALAAVPSKSTSAYHEFLGQVLKQHAEMLRSNGKQDEAEALLKTFIQ